MVGFGGWWNSLILTEQVLYCIAIPATLVLVIQVVLIIAGAGGDAMDSGGLDTDGGIPGEFSAASMFTLQGVASFFTVFGWTAVLLTGAGVPLILCIGAGTALGGLVMFALARLMFALSKLAQTGTLDTRNMLGCGGTVYLRIPPKGNGKGKVTVQMSERLVEFDAVSADGEEIPNNAEIRVIDIVGESTLVVEPA